MEECANVWLVMEEALVHHWVANLTVVALDMVIVVSARLPTLFLIVPANLDSLESLASSLSTTLVLLPIARMLRMLLAITRVSACVHLDLLEICAISTM